MKIIFLIFITLSVSCLASDNSFWQADMKNSENVMLEKGTLDNNQILRCLIIPDKFYNSENKNSFVGITLGDEKRDHFIRIGMYSFEKDNFQFHFLEYKNSKISDSFQFNEFTESLVPFIMIGFQNKEKSISYFSGPAEVTEKAILKNFDGKLSGLKYQVVATGVSISYKCKLEEI